MSGGSYLRWAIESTKTHWWHDSADPSELMTGIERGAVGATTNPFLSNLALEQNREAWAGEIDAVLSEDPQPEEKAEALMGIVIRHAARKLMPEYERSQGESGFICAQVNPSRAGDREPMLAAARRLTLWAPNIAVKLPATQAGLDVLEDCTAEGITCTLTISYTVAQTVAIAKRYRKGLERARKSGVQPGKCFPVIMIGRLDDYLREVAHDGRVDVNESDIRQAGLAVTKRTCSLYRERGYEATLIVAALRGTYHMTELAGAPIIMSIAVPYQEMLLSETLAREERIDIEVPADVIGRLSRIPDFVRAYEPDGMKASEFITYGVTQRTLASFHESGWKLLEGFTNR